MVLCNYEHQTGETLSQDDLHTKNLATKLLPEDYDFKSQVSTFPSYALTLEGCYHQTLSILARLSHPLFLYSKFTTNFASSLQSTLSVL